MQSHTLRLTIKKKWAFCLSHEESSWLPEGNYKVVIDSEFKKGNLSIIEAIFSW